VTPDYSSAVLQLASRDYICVIFPIICKYMAVYQQVS